jgi:hypothetical protein
VAFDAFLVSFDFFDFFEVSAATEVFEYLRATGTLTPAVFSASLASGFYSCIGISSVPLNFPGPLMTPFVH